MHYRLNEPRLCTEIMDIKSFRKQNRALDIRETTAAVPSLAPENATKHFSNYFFVMYDIWCQKEKIKGLFRKQPILVYKIETTAKSEWALRITSYC